MRNFYINHTFFYAILGLGIGFILAYIIPVLFTLVKIAVLFFIVLAIVDIFLLFRAKKGLRGRRLTGDKLSNGDENPIEIYLENFYRFPISVRVIDEVPFQFQVRDTDYNIKIASANSKGIKYNLRPVERGEYDFGYVNAFVSSPIRFFARRYRVAEPVVLPVYPSFLQMRKYELLAFSNRLSDYGMKKMRRIGQSMEFEQIKTYVQGDDIRNVNWKATARKGQLMVNQFQDEKAQRVYSIIDKGRVMKMPFEGMTLLDYAINASLVISNIAVKKGDKAGLVTFEKKINTVVRANNVGMQMRRIQEALYNQKTGFLESNFERLYALLTTKLNNRSLVILYTNFETQSGLKRQLTYLRKIARRHVLVVVFFHNTELDKMTKERAENLVGIYDKVIAEKLAYEKRLIVKELNRYGIHTILTAPEDLTVNTINKYLELKARGMI